MADLEPGDLVRHVSTSEEGVVVCVWTDEHGDQDCYVAFVSGGCRPEEKPEKPYVLRYYSSSLEKL